MAQNIESMKDLYVHFLKDLHSAEKQIAEALPKMEKAATSPELKQGFRQHTEESRAHMDRLERILDRLGEEPGKEKCEALAGLVKEGEEVMKNVKDPEVLDAGLIAAAQKVEHYEIASYGTVRTFAQMLGDDEAVDLLQQTLDEEASTDERLNQLAMSGVNRAAAR